MNFTCAHHFANIAPDAYGALYFEESFNAEMCQAVGLGRVLVSQQTSDGVLTRVTQIVPQRALPAPIAKLIGAQSFGYTETVRYRVAEHAGSWDVVPNVLAGKIVSNGEFSFTAERGGTLRTVHGKVVVSVFALGSTIERAVVGDVERSYQEAATFTERYLQSRRSLAPSQQRGRPLK